MAGQDLEHAVADLVKEYGGKHDSDYVTHMIVTALGLGTDSTSTLDLKIASSALKEMREAFAMFDPYANRKKVTIFGSARTKKDDPLYLHTQNVAAELAAQGWMVVTGAGPGIMEAGTMPRRSPCASPARASVERICGRSFAQGWSVYRSTMRSSRSSAESTMRHGSVSASSGLWVRHRWLSNAKWQPHAGKKQAKLRIQAQRSGPIS